MKELYDQIRKNSAQCIEELVTLCRYQSISAYKETHKEKVAECAQHLVQMMNSIGIETTMSSVGEGNPIILGELKSKKSGAKTIMFYNHYDVQPVDPLNEWNSDPFAPVEKDGRLYGRGVADNKGTIVARLAAVRSVIDVLGETPVNLKFLFEGEEEIGSPTLATFVQRNKDALKADGCLWEGSERDMSGRLVVRLGNKGMLYVELSAHGARSDQHSKWAPIVPNPAWRLCWALTSVRSASGEVLVRGFYDGVREPTQKEVMLLKEIPFDEKAYRELFGVSSLIERGGRVKLVKKLLFSPTCNIAGFHSGYGGPGSKTVLPSEAVAKLDLRLVPDQKPSKVLELLTSHLGKSGFGDVDVRMLHQMEPARSSFDSPIVNTVLQSARDVYGMDPIVYPISMGSSPIYTAINILKIPTVGVGGVGRNDSNVHGPNETIRSEDFIRGIELAARIVSTF